MTTETPPAAGTTAGIGLTVDNAGEVRDSYAAVDSRAVESMSVDDCRDYVPSYLGGRGDVERSLARGTELGGTAITPIMGLGEGTSNAVVRVPAGAVLALSGPTPNEP